MSNPGFTDGFFPFQTALNNSADADDTLGPAGVATDVVSRWANRVREWLLTGTVSMNYSGGSWTDDGGNANDIPAANYEKDFGDADFPMKWYDSFDQAAYPNNPTEEQVPTLPDESLIFPCAQGFPGPSGFPYTLVGAEQDDGQSPFPNPPAPDGDYHQINTQMQLFRQINTLRTDGTTNFRLPVQDLGDGTYNVGFTFSLNGDIGTPSASFYIDFGMDDSPPDYAPTYTVYTGDPDYDPGTAYPDPRYAVSQTMGKMKIDGVEIDVFLTVVYQVQAGTMPQYTYDPPPELYPISDATASMTVDELSLDPSKFWTYDGAYDEDSGDPAGQ